MCNRFTLTAADLETLCGWLDAEVAPEQAVHYRPRFNIAPSDVHWLVQAGPSRPRLSPAVWGLPGAQGLLLNVRAETATAKPRFLDAFRRRRCVIPADGFFEWMGPRDDRRPVWFHSPGGELLLMAGLFELEGEQPRFAVLTTAANEAVGRVHDRMPLLLPRARLEAWLAAPREELLTGAPVDIIGSEVSTRVNSVEHDDPACLQAPPRGSQMRLF